MNIIKLLKGLKKEPAKAISEEERFEVTLSGSGGQGMILAGKILAEAASLYGGKEAVMTQSYGPEARGGASRAEIIISSQKIEYPKVMKVNILLAMTQEAMDKYGKLLEKDGLLIVDEGLVKKVPPGIKNVFKAPFTSVAISLLGEPIVANIIALSSLAAITNIVSREDLIQAVIARVPDRVVVLDRVAVDAGFMQVNDSGFIWKLK